MNQAPQLTKEEAHNALTFLERVSTQGVKEAVVLASLANKLAQIKAHVPQEEPQSAEDSTATDE